MNTATIETDISPTDAKELDDLLWKVLWKPLGLPRDIRNQFRVNGEHLELVAKDKGQIVGGLVAVWNSNTEVELRHLAVIPDAQNKGTGQQLISGLVKVVTPRGCRRIRTIARNTSVDFFRKAGFRKMPGIAPEHPDFKKYGIVFELMEKTIE